MDIQHLRYFLAVARELHFGRAAQRLHVTASPLSRRIRELEHELGHDLFVREHHRVALTSFGLVFRDRCQEVVTAFDGLLDVAHAHSDLPHCRVGSALLAPPDMVEAVLDAYREVAPGMELPLTLGSSAELLDLLVAGRLDLAAVHLPRHLDGKEHLRLARGSLAVVMRKDDELAERSSLALRDLRQRQVLMTSAKVHPLVMGELRAALLEAGVTDLVDLPHNDVLQTAARVRHTGALTLTTLRAYGQDMPSAPLIHASQSLHTVPLDEPGLTLSAGITWSPGGEESVPGLCEVIAVLRERYGNSPLRM